MRQFQFPVREGFEPMPIKRLLLLIVAMTILIVLVTLVLQVGVTATGSL